MVKHRLRRIILSEINLGNLEKQQERGAGRVRGTVFMTGKTAIILLTGAALLTSGCATVTRGKSEQVQFTSVPSGAVVSTTMGASCTTPCSLEVLRKQAFNASFQHRGQTRIVKVITKSQGEGVAAGVGNVLIGGVVGVAVDAGTGATLDHVPNPVHADFTKPQSQAQAIADAHAAAVKKAKADEKS